MRSEMTLLLLCGLTLMTGGCDRRSGENGQGGTNAAAANVAAAPTSGEVSPGEVAPGAGGDHGAFTAKLDRSKAGAEAPDMIFTDPAGKDVTLAAFRGKPLLVNLWATWCGPCVAEMPMLNAIAARYKAQGLVVLTVSQDTGEDAAPITAFFAKNKLPNLSAYRDPENLLGFHYATGVLPTTILYDRDGKEVVRVVGAKDWADTEGQALIEDLVD